MNLPVARDLAVGLALGTIDASGAIAWADHWIMALDHPPYWLIEISTARDASARDLLHFIPEPSTSAEPSDIELLGAIAVRLIDRAEPLGILLPILMDRFCFCDWTEMTATRQSIYLIDDELGWDPERAVRTASKFLENYVDEGRRQLARTLATPPTGPIPSPTPSPDS